MKIQTRSATALLFLSAALAACGGSAATAAPAGQGQASTPAQAGSGGQSAAPAGSTAAIDACALVTQAEVKAFLGYDPGPANNTGDATSPACAYGGALTFVVEPGAGKAAFDRDRGGAPGSDTLHDLTGIGDGAYAVIVANTVAQMEILKGTTVLMVNVQGDPSLQNITVAALTTLATTVVGRL